MHEVFEKIIEKLEEKIVITWKHDYEGGRKDAFNEAVEIVKQEAEKFGSDTNVGSNGWIPCSVVDHPEHSHDCEVTMINNNNYTREIAFFSCTGRWMRSIDLAEITVVAWKEPSEPYKPKGE